jgi:ATP-dependent Lhr-like helicase
VADRLDDPERAIKWLVETFWINEPGARQIVGTTATRQILGTIPTQQCLVPSASSMKRVACGWSCMRRSAAGSIVPGVSRCASGSAGASTELQAAATEDAILLSLGPQHSSRSRTSSVSQAGDGGALAGAGDARRAGVRHAALELDAALAVLRFRGGRKVPTPLQRMEAEDLVAAVFPDQLACPENLVGDREIPDHPLVNQTIADCLLEAMDFPGLQRILKDGSRSIR